jgi:glycosyltransferase involved in cell wall biosynthesis
MNANSDDIVEVLHPITRLIVGGAQENTMYTADLLDKRRFHVSILSGPQTGSEGSLIEVVLKRNIPLQILPELVREINPYKDLVALFKMYVMMKNGNYAIVHTHSSKAGILGRLAAKLAGVPLIVHTVHGWSFHGRMSALKRYAYVILERLFAKITHIMIVVTKEDIKKGLSFGIGHPHLYHLVRSAIPLAEYNPFEVDKNATRKELGIPQDALVMGNIGRLSDQKNPLDWIRVAKLVSGKVPSCFFLLVGDGPLQQDIEQIAAELGIAEKIKFTGIRRDVSRMLSAMDLFVITSLWEGLPRVIPQAMLMGLPVVANIADGTVEAVEHAKTGYLCNPGKVEEMAEYCVDLLENPKKCMEMGKMGREYALEEFDLNKMIKQIEELYGNHLNKGF